MSQYQRCNLLVLQYRETLGHPRSSIGFLSLTPDAALQAMVTSSHLWILVQESAFVAQAFEILYWLVSPYTEPSH